MSDRPDHPNLRELLDAVRPDSEDLHDQGLASALRDLGSGEDWQTAFESQQDFDRIVGAAMRQVVVPVGLKGQLLATLADARSPVSPAKSPHRGRWLGSRRGMLVSAAGLLLACATWLVWPSQPPALTLDEVRASLPVADGLLMWGRLDAFDDSFAIPLPDTAWNGMLGQKATGLDLNGDQQHDAAIVPFDAGAQTRTRGYLMIVRASALADQPANSRLSLSGISYVPVPNTAWKSRDGQFVYVCFVEDGRLEGLYSRLYGSSA